MELENISKGADELLNRLVMAFRNPDGSVHPQSLLCCIGALSGQACLYSAYEKYSSSGIKEADIFNIVKSKAGEKFYFGELTDELLFKNKYSVWSFLCSAVKKSGGEYPDVNELLNYGISVCGSEKFGKVRNCLTGENIVGYLELFWKSSLETALKYCGKEEIYVLFGALTQKIILICVKNISAKECSRIVMESAGMGCRLKFF